MFEANWGQGSFWNTVPVHSLCDLFYYSRFTPWKLLLRIQNPSYSDKKQRLQLWQTLFYSVLFIAVAYWQRWIQLSSVLKRAKEIINHTYPSLCQILDMQMVEWLEPLNRLALLSYFYRIHNFPQIHFQK